MKETAPPANRLPSLIFDFDGTLADSLELVIATYNRVAPRLGVRPVEPRSLPQLRAMKPQAALREHGVSLWKLPLLAHLMRAEMRTHMDALEPCPGIVLALAALAARGHRCSILSTNSSENIRRFLARHRLTCFEQIAGGASMFGKARALRALVRRAQLDPGSTYYVGDEVRDVQAAARAKLRSIAVSWGYADREVLSGAGPDHLIDRPEDLLALMAAAERDLH